MARVIAALIFLVAVGWFVRHQFNMVIKQATSKNPPPAFTSSPASSTSPFAHSQESRIKCIMCNGTGRSAFIGFGGPGKSGVQVCQSCHGIGWVDNPMYRR
jgi:hypothetical protein